MILRLLVLLILCTFHSLALEAQKDTNSKAVKMFEAAYSNYKAGKLDEAIDLIDKALAIDKNYYNGFILKGDILLKMNRTDDAVDEYKKAIKADTKGNTKIRNYLGDILYGSGRYGEAKEYYDDPLKRDRCNFALQQMANPVSFTPINLGDNINTQFDEYFPTFTADDSLMIFTRRVVPNGIPTNEDFFFSRRNKTSQQWEKAQSMGFPINTYCNEGTPYISANGNILLFTSCEDLSREEECRRTLGRCDIFFSLLRNNEWSNPTNIGAPVNSSAYESQPSLSADGRTLYFVRAETDSRGNMDQDIYCSTLNDSGKWSDPVRLNSNINTSGRESSPFIHPDGCTLYFSSDGHQGMGGMDIFVSRKDETGEWGKAQNLCYPINTHRDETSLVVSASGKWGYFSSDREGGYGGIDIYQFEMPEELKPIETTMLKDKTIVINNILFDFDSYVLRDHSYQELDNIAKLMNDNPSLTIEVAGHTDSSGKQDYNNELSLKRAESISNYLISKGISPSRVIHKGYGSSRPLCEDDTDECRALNRRIEMKLNGVVKNQ